MTYKVGDKATISEQWRDGRVWGDTVEITDVGEIDGQTAYNTRHEAYGDWGCIMFDEELEPLTEQEETLAARRAKSDLYREVPTGGEA